MNDPMNAPVTPQPASAGNAQIMAIISIVAGVISLCGVIPVIGPIIGIPLGIIGVVLGYFGRKDAAWKTYAIVGMALSGVGILLSCGSLGLITVMRLLGPKIGNTFSSISNSLP